MHSEAYSASLDMLASHHVCVISGEPGIGKTTLAETLLVRFMSDGWEINTASGDISDIERVWRPGEKQVFLYDDFLGQNSLLDSLNKNEDNRLLHIAEKIAGDDSKRLIMTTREYILRQARQIYPRLRLSQLLFEERVVLNLADYTRLQKAQILYNHVHFADLHKDALSSLLADQNYLDIIHHSSFNPRVIELVTSNFKSSGTPGENFYRYTLAALDNPRELWESIFQDQLTPGERHILLVLATVRYPIEVTDLFRGVSSYESAMGASFTSPHDLSLALKKLQGTFVRITSNARLDDQSSGIHPANRSSIVQLANPSFIDFISSYLSSHPGEISQAARGAAFFEQVETLVHWDIVGSLDDRLIVSLMDAFFGGRSMVRQSPRLAPGQQRVLVEALTRLEDSPSCYWVEMSNSYATSVRQPVSVAARHLVMTMLDAKYRRSLLARHSLAVIVEKMGRRIVSANALSASQEIRLISRLAGYPQIEASVTKVRDALAARLMESLNCPEDFQAALSPFTESGVAPSRWSTGAEAELRRRFRNFISEWDLEESGRVNSVADCEDAIARLVSAMEDFETSDSDTPILKDRLALLEDEVAQDLDFQDEEDVDDDRDSPAVYPSQPHAKKDYLAPIDPVVELFDTLG
ncbi:hypothetical protein ACIQUQ_29710 [Streptomyces sp. NPDC101118]|uniref:nSTAND3 domain-containing NTPase n=1 Tax=Streptomyces sp. NPDC101118 TaxID=3366109 RepID=UPI003828E617